MTDMDNNKDNEQGCFELLPVGGFFFDGPKDDEYAYLCVKVGNAAGDSGSTTHINLDARRSSSYAPMCAYPATVKKMVFTTRTVCLNGTVSGGKDMMNCKLQRTTEVLQLIKNMGPGTAFVTDDGMVGIAIDRQGQQARAFVIGEDGSLSIREFGATAVASVCDYTYHASYTE